MEVLAFTMPDDAAANRSDRLASLYPASRTTRLLNLFRCTSQMPVSGHNEAGVIPTDHDDGRSEALQVIIECDTGSHGVDGISATGFKVDSSMDSIWMIGS